MAEVTKVILIKSVMKEILAFSSNHVFPPHNS